MKYRDAISTLMVLLLLALVVVNGHAAPIQKWTDANGDVHYGAKPPLGAQSTSVEEAPPGNGNPSQVTESERVVLYSTSWCGYCKKARAYMRKNGIAFTELDIEKDLRAKSAYKRAGGVGIPFLVKGERVLRGFRASSYDRFFSEE